ncbi:MAG: thioredoxin family protein [Bacteroidales bacterium]|nr:thioredoxin family protein [Bacteroidales bacterium]
MRSSLPIVRILLGAVFILSAGAKLWSIDLFELYIYSFRYFPLNLTFILARLCIGAELALGVLALTGWHRRPVLATMLAMLFFFSIFLCCAALIGREDSCQCFGQLADMPPAVSLLKNSVLILLTLLCLRRAKESRSGKVEESKSGKVEDTKRNKIRAWLTGIIIAAALATPFIISVPDSWMFGPSHEHYDAEALHEALEGETNDRFVIEQDRCLVVFVTPGCPYCKMTRQKLDAMSQRYFFHPGDIVYIEPDDLPDGMFLRITYGARPLILMMDRDKVVATYHYRNINERQIVRFLRNK